MRPDSRQPAQLRPITFQHGVAPHATGSVLVSFGNTRVICAATVEEKVPRWMQIQKVSGGWLTAEYNMLPYSTHNRKQRDGSRGGPDGRSIEIQRLIGRSLRAVVDLQKLGSRTVWIDCDVLQADGGTRTASITGGCVAAAIAFEKLLGEGLIEENPLREMISAVSAGIYKDTAILDLNYPEDRDADVDFNAVITESGNFVELQGSGEEATFTPEQMSEMLALCKSGAQEIVALQREAIAAANTPSTNDLDALANAFSS